MKTLSTLPQNYKSTLKSGEYQKYQNDKRPAVCFMAYLMEQYTLGVLFHGIPREERIPREVIV